MTIQFLTKINILLFSFNLAKVLNDENIRYTAIYGDIIISVSITYIPECVAIICSTIITLLKVPVKKSNLCRLTVEPKLTKKF